MVRPRWHDVVIAAAILLLAGAGVAALWGREIRALVRGEAIQEEAAMPPPAEAL